VPENPKPVDPIPPPAPTFIDLFLGRSMGFASSLLSTQPELESVTMIPTWLVPDGQLPPAIICGRNGEQRTATEVVHLVDQLARTMRVQLDWLQQYLANFDQQAAMRARAYRDLEQRLTQKQQELTDLEAKINDRAATYANLGGQQPAHPATNP